MDIPLKPELEKFIDDQVEVGRFTSAAEVVEAGLARLMLDPIEDAEPLDPEDIAAIEEAEAQFARGESLTVDQAREHFRRRGVDLRLPSLRQDR
jgi:putative addiction module CopG family antidote